MEKTILQRSPVSALDVRTGDGCAKTACRRHDFLVMNGFLPGMKHFARFCNIFVIKFSHFYHVYLKFP